jgi:peptidoglycan glycosyltransferase
MRSGIQTTAWIIALGLLGYGVFQPVDHDARWLVCLWLAAPLLGLAAWFSRSPLPRGFHRSVHNLGIVVAIGFALLGLQLLRQQIIQANAISNRVNIDSETGQITSNVRPVISSQRVIRGKIFAKDDILLVSSEVVQDGFVRRVYPFVDRFYDAGAFSNIVGFFSTRFGQAGLEATYSEFLSGKRGSELTQLQNDLLGKAQVGNDLYLTIHAPLQARAKNLLGARTGSIIVLDPSSGAILAMVSNPGFDPRGLSFDYTAQSWDAENQRISEYWQYLNSDSAGQPLINRPTQGLYPPGSTFKTVTAIGVLEHPDVGKPDDIHCYNQYQTEPGAPPVVNAVQDLASLTGDPSTLERVYAYSCNVAFAQYALRLGKERMSDLSMLFDIYRPQEAPDVYPHFLELPTASSLISVNPAFLDRRAALADTGYGQGQLLVNPLQMALITAAIANNGVMMKPYLVERIERPNKGGIIFQQVPRIIRRTMSEDTAKKMRDNMRAVGEYGFGSVVSSQVPGVTVGGKSGTGEHVPGAAPHAWFIALAPVEQPRFAVVAMIERGGEGSSVAATLAGQVLQAAFELE